ncbi:TetR/AcrR family transcriptional regulator [Thalassospira sp. GB04J01]|uniref:TetR/AcrR family transcriptional regulator n=1 Tax=Thalassospira sp. GB04J01 TaxID=1485225 RepID=UPI001FCA653D|nr:TetR/AcrR family transcriptional regulator [Thalassospira sp. GB04J01]
MRKDIDRIGNAYRKTIDDVKRSFYIFDMNIKTKLLTAAEQLFDQHGFMATSMDRLTAAADMSSRTLYKHIGGKTGLVTAVLTARDERFMQKINVNSLDELFNALAEWVRDEGARGCLFLRAYGETGGNTPEIAEVVLDHKAAFRNRLDEIVRSEVGLHHANVSALVDQILILIEGATSVSVYQGEGAISAARDAAAVLITQARS